MNTLSSSEQSQYRSLVGKLGWMVQGTRPDLSFQWLEASTKNKAATMKDMSTLQKRIYRAKETKAKILFRNLGDISMWDLVVYSDAAHANLGEKTSSTGGCVIFLVGQEDKCCPIFWKASKLKRVCRSSAAAEGLSLVEGIDIAIYLREIICELLKVDKDSLKINAYTDHEGLRTNISNILDPKVLDKRSKIDIAYIRQLIQSGMINEIVWCSTSSQLADCLTKQGASGIKLLSVLETGFLSVQ